MIEIERKFLVLSSDFKEEAYKKTRIIQGFLNTHKKRTVRVRLIDNEGVLTVKGLSSKNGLSRFEWEKAITKEDVLELLKLCEPVVIDKIRYLVKAGNHIFEVDEFLADNEGLIIAEIELKNENETFEKPFWLGKEVTGDIKYYNSQLSKQPYNTWNT
ncbi:CYTH domain-containing protein [Algibacter luteus]|uniref:CYTH domain-containing protein n=1 Tax=Algibacter luteus TaxID=1178825 RepID=A0A1M6DKH8_9FLAO|nr:CYTH domain-containing protein [Algibacter luteus]SHI73488.1 CYTH domain-containing protein [Algibacter luteus]